MPSAVGSSCRGLSATPEALTVAGYRWHVPRLIVRILLGSGLDAGAENSIHRRRLVASNAAVFTPITYPTVQLHPLFRNEPRCCRMIPNYRMKAFAAV